MMYIASRGVKLQSKNLCYLGRNLLCMLVIFQPTLSSTSYIFMQSSVLSPFKGSRKWFLIFYLGFFSYRIVMVQERFKTYPDK